MIGPTVIYLSSLICLLLVTGKVHVSGTSDGDIRLQGSTDHWQGRVEIFYNNTWGTVCDDYWDKREGMVVCHQLGYTDAIKMYPQAAFGEGKGPIFLDNIQCIGNETKLTDCSHNGWGVHNCKHSEDGGVACAHNSSNPNTPGSCSFDDDFCGYINSQDDDFDWKRESNSTPSYATGPSHDHTTGYGSYIYIETSYPRVQGEVARIVSPKFTGAKCVKFYYHMKGETINELNVYVDNGEERKMVWQKKGEMSKVWNKAAIPIQTVTAFQIVFEALTGTKHTGDIAIDDVQVLGKSCIALVPSDAKPIPVDLSNITSTIRLVGTNVSSAGRIEIFHENRWGTVCGNHFHLPAAKVVCRQLGYLDVETIVPCCSMVPAGKGMIWLDNLHCEGREPAISMCPHKGWGMTKCVHNQDVSIICKTNTTLKDVRLGGSINNFEGRAEVQIGGIWGTIMDIGWDIYDSTVFCKQLGFAGATGVYNAAHYGIGQGPVWISSALCIGNESALWQCNLTQHQIQWNPHPWPWPWWNPHRRDAGVECYNLRLTGGKTNMEGIVEIQYFGTWGTICNNGWDMNDAAVVCRQLGYSKAVTLDPGYEMATSSKADPTLTRLKCKGDEPALGLCAYDVLRSVKHSCTHDKDRAKLVCAEPIPTLSPSPGFKDCNNNCPYCYKNIKHGGVCVCSQKVEKLKCDATIGVNVVEVRFINLSRTNFDPDSFKMKLSRQLNAYCKAHSCGISNMTNVAFSFEDIFILDSPNEFQGHLNMQLIVLNPVLYSKNIIHPQYINAMVKNDNGLAGYTVTMSDKPPVPQANTASTAGKTVKIVVPIVILFVLAMCIVAFIMYRKRGAFSEQPSSTSQHYLHLSQDNDNEQDDPLLSMNDDEMDNPMSVQA